jgi:hypothetical protein
MYAIRKSDLKSFTTKARAVCRIEDGSTNSYLREDRLVEAFLKGIEPKYNVALAKLTADKIDPECIYVIAGFVTYVLVCSPGGMRIQSHPWTARVEEHARLLDSKGRLPTPPPQLGGKSLTELLESGNTRVKIDPKFPQAIGIASILHQIKRFGNFNWDILINPFDDSPFFTSDFPIAIEKSEQPRILNRIAPLAPNLAIRIRPDRSFDRERADFSFSSFRHTVRKLSRPEVLSINRLIVRCAENIVFFPDDYEWIPKFVKKNSQFRIEPKTRRVSDRTGTRLLFTLEVIETRSRT